MIDVCLKNYIEGIVGLHITQLKTSLIELVKK